MDKTFEHNIKKGTYQPNIPIFMILDRIICRSAPSEYFWRSLVTGTSTSLYLPYSNHKKVASRVELLLCSLQSVASVKRRQSISGLT